MQVARTLKGLNHGNKLVFRRVKVYFQRVPGKTGPDANRAIDGVPYTVKVGGQVVSRGETGYDGAISLVVPAELPIELSIFGTVYNVTLADYMEPVTDVRGRQRRLSMLGYELGDIDGTKGLRYERAVLNFQADNALNPDGDAGGITQPALESLSVKS
jgi:hypothetical protein